MTGAAHELNNPLTAILGVSDLLREHAVDEPTRRRARLDLAAGAPSRGHRAGSSRIFPPRGAGEHQDRGSRDGGSGAALAANVLAAREHSREVRNAPAFLRSRAMRASIASVHESDRKCRAIDRGCTRKRNIEHFAVEAGEPRVRHISDDGAGISPENMGKISTRFSRRSGPEAEAASALRFALRWSRNTAEGSKWNQRPRRGTTFHVFCPLRRALRRRARRYRGALKARVVRAAICLKDGRF